MKVDMKKTLLLFYFLGLTFFIHAQGFAFGVKGGSTLAFQKWNGFERSVLPRYNASIFMETLPAQKRFSIFGELGYHVKGSRIKVRSFNPTTSQSVRRNLDTEFRNVSLVLGGKSAYPISANNIKAYYLFGLRGDYNVSYDFAGSNPLFVDDDVNKFTYGFTFGGGLEFPLSRLVGMIVELQISPDARPQVYYPFKIYDPGVGYDPITLGETKVFNTALEITVGFRFLRVVEYVEE